MSSAHRSSWQNSSITFSVARSSASFPAPKPAQTINSSCSCTDRFATVTSIRLFIALDVIGLEQSLQATVGAVIKTTLVFVWLVFTLRASQLLLTAMSGHQQCFEFVQPTTEP